MATRKAERDGVAVPSLNDLMRELAVEVGCGLYAETRKPDEFTSLEFAKISGLSDARARKILIGLMRDGVVERRKFKLPGQSNRILLYRRTGKKAKPRAQFGVLPLL